MTGIGDFMLTVCAASAASALLNAIMPDGSTKKYVNLLISLSVLLLLLSPLKSVSSTVSIENFYAAVDTDAAEIMAKANGIVARRIGTAVSEKFSVPSELVSCKHDGSGVTVRMPVRIGLVAEDVRLFIANRFGVASEVIFYER